AANRSEIRSRRADETPTIPTAAATANVSSPSGRTSAMSLATTPRDYGEFDKRDELDDPYATAATAWQHPLANPTFTAVFDAPRTGMSGSSPTARSISRRSPPRVIGSTLSRVRFSSWARGQGPGR